MIKIYDLNEVPEEEIFARQERRRTCPPRWRTSSAR